MYSRQVKEGPENRWQDDHPACEETRYPQSPAELIGLPFEMEGEKGCQEKSKNIKETIVPPHFDTPNYIHTKMESLGQCMKNTEK